MDNNTLRDEILSATESSSLLRKLMSSEEIKEANKLVKEGLLYKGVSDDKQKTVIYYQ